MSTVTSAGVAEHDPQRLRRCQGVEVAFVPGVGVRPDLLLDQVDAGQKPAGETQEPALGPIAEVRVAEG
jgi:hypothetical protein